MGEEKVQRGKDWQKAFLLVLVPTNHMGKLSTGSLTGPDLEAGTLPNFVPSTIVSQRRCQTGTSQLQHHHLLLCISSPRALPHGPLLLLGRCQLFSLQAFYRTIRSSSSLTRTLELQTSRRQSSDFDDTYHVASWPVHQPP